MNPTDPKYKLIGAVQGLLEGAPVNLALQQRLDVPPVPFFTMSWRTTYPGKTQNRRYYWSKGGSCWTIPVPLAKELLERAAEKGLLDDKYDDAYERFGGGGPTFIDSSDIAPSERTQLWREVTNAEREPDWGSSPRFVVATEAGGRWRKVMIIDTGMQLATFRSCTTSTDYRPVLILPEASWRMDNAMQDANPAMMRRFLAVLRPLA